MLAYVYPILGIFWSMLIFMVWVPRASSTSRDQAILMEALLH